MDWRWSPFLAQALRNSFAGAERIDANFSQAFQDIFVLSMLGGRRGGSYLEIGAHHPVENNNTYLLHRNYGWKGVSVEIDPSHQSAWRKARPRSRLVIADALELNYNDALPAWFDQRRGSSWPRWPAWLQRPRSAADARRIDYLQLDIEPSENTLAVLKALPLDEYRFSVITFETDVYAGDMRARDESRAILGAHGYRLVGPNVSVLYTPISPDPIPFEDWWVDPQVVPEEKIARARASSADGAATCLPQQLLFDC